MAQVPTKRLRVTVSSPDGTRIIVNEDDRATQLGVDFGCLMTVNPQRNQGVCVLTNLSEQKRNALQKAIDTTIDYALVGLPSILAANTPITESEAAIQANVGADIPATIAATQTAQKTITLESGKAYVEIDGGEDDEIGRIFEGSVEGIESAPSGPEWTTTLQIADGQAGTAAAIEVSFPRGAQLFSVVRFITQSMGLESGNFNRITLGAAIGANAKAVFERPLVIVNSADTILNQIFQLTGAEWWVDRGKFFVVRKGQPLPDAATRLEVGRGGLRSRPRQLDKGAVAIEADFVRGLRVGRRVEVAVDRDVSIYRTDQVNHVVNNREGGWSTAALLRPIPKV